MNLSVSCWSCWWAPSSRRWWSPSSAMILTRIRSLPKKRWSRLWGIYRLELKLAMGFHLDFLNQKPTCPKNNYSMLRIMTLIKYQVLLTPSSRSTQMACTLMNSSNSVKKSVLSCFFLYLIAFISWCHVYRTISFWKQISSNWSFQKLRDLISATLLRHFHFCSPLSVRRIWKGLWSTRMKNLRFRKSWVQMLILKECLLQRTRTPVVSFTKNPKWLYANHNKTNAAIHSEPFQKWETFTWT